jgi:hypothetical protein
MVMGVNLPPEVEEPPCCPLAKSAPAANRMRIPANIAFIVFFIKAS